MSDPINLCKDCKHSKAFNEGRIVRCANIEVNRNNEAYLARADDGGYAEFASCVLERARYFNPCGKRGKLWGPKAEVPK